MSPHLIYIPAEGDKKAFWLNLSATTKILEEPDGGLVVYWVNCVPLSLTGKRAAVLRLHLTGRLLSHRPEPELPRIPDPMIVPPAVTEFEEKLSARGTVA